MGDIAPFFDANSLYPYLYNCELWSGLLGGSVNGGLQLYCYNCLFDRSAITFSTTAGSPYSYCYSELHKYLHNRQIASAAYRVSFNAKNDKTNSIFLWIESKVALVNRFICSLDSINNFPIRAFK